MLELTGDEARGGLIEKQLTVPDQYPLSLNAAAGLLGPAAVVGSFR